jgi:DNA repair photolyase
MLLKKRCGVIKDYQEWLKPKLVSNAIELLKKELPRHKNRIQYVHLCFSTDPFMYGFPEVRELTLRIIEELRKNEIKAVILTKGLLPQSLISAESFGTENDYGITLISLDDEFKQTFEPNAAPYRERVSSLRFLHSRGLKTWVSIEPYPTPNMIKQDLQNILDEVSFVNKVVFGKMNYNPLVRQYKGWEEFYEECTEKVIEHCHKSNIELHIKQGTSRRHDDRDKARLGKKDINTSDLTKDFRPGLFG